MDKLSKATILVLFGLPVILSGNQKNEMDYKFVQDNNSYSFQGCFIVNAEFDCLIQVIYNFEHISNYTTGAKSIELIQAGKNWYDVTYIYRKLVIFENRSTWRRTLKRSKGKVVFEMISSKNNLNIMPKVLTSTGYYQIKPDKKGHQVEYIQECKLKPGFLKSSYIKAVKKEAIRFLYEFKAYIEKTCVFSDSTRTE